MKMTNRKYVYRLRGGEKGSGWILIMRVNGRTYREYFSDSKYKPRRGRKYACDTRDLILAMES